MWAENKQDNLLPVEYPFQGGSLFSIVQERAKTSFSIGQTVRNQKREQGKGNTVCTVKGKEKALRNIRK